MASSGGTGGMREFSTFNQAEKELRNHVFGEFLVSIRALMTSFNTTKKIEELLKDFPQNEWCVFFSLHYIFIIIIFFNFLIYDLII